MKNKTLAYLLIISFFAAVVSLIYYLQVKNSEIQGIEFPIHRLKSKAQETSDFQ